MSEHAIQADIFRAIGGRPDVRIFRNNTAGSWGGKIIGRTPTTITLLNPRPIHAGLFQGSADLIGWRSRTITAAEVGFPIAVFTSLEVKSPDGVLRPGQIPWRDAILRAGGIAGIVRSVEEAEALFL